jgi:hypothetical protein
VVSEGGYGLMPRHFGTPQEQKVFGLATREKSC